MEPRVGLCKGHSLNGHCSCVVEKSSDASNRVMSYTTSLVSLHHSEPIHYHLPCYPSSHTCNSLPSSPCRHNSHPTPSHHYNLPQAYHNSHSLSPPYYSHPHLHPPMLGVHASSEKYPSSPRRWHSPTRAPPCRCHSSPKTRSRDHPCVQTTAEIPLEKVVKNKQAIGLTKWCFRLVNQSLILEGFYLDLGKTWKSGPVVDRRSATVLVTHSGSVYHLLGELNVSALSRQCAELLGHKFKNGFPSSWKKDIADVLNGVWCENVELGDCKEEVEADVCGTNDESKVIERKDLKIESMEREKAAKENEQSEKVEEEDKEEDEEEEEEEEEEDKEKERDKEEKEEDKEEKEEEKKNEQVENKEEQPANMSSVSDWNLSALSSSGIFTSMKRSSRGRLLKPVQSQFNDPSSPLFSYGYSYTGSGDVTGINIVDLTLDEEDMKNTTQTSSELADKSLPAKDANSSLSSLSNGSNVKLCLNRTPVVSLTRVSTPAKERREDNGLEVGKTGDRGEEWREDNGLQAKGKGRRGRKRRSWGKKQEVENTTGDEVDQSRGRKSSDKNKVEESREADKGRERRMKQVNRKNVVHETREVALKTSCRSQSYDNLSQQEVVILECDPLTDNVPTWSVTAKSKLRKIAHDMPTLTPNFWEAVAVKMGGDFSAEECQSVYYQHTKTTKGRGRPRKVKETEKKEEKEKVVNGEVKLGRPGTLKRKRQLRSALEEMDEGHNDDIFEDGRSSKRKALLRLNNYLFESLEEEEEEDEKEEKREEPSLLPFNLGFKADSPPLCDYLTSDDLTVSLRRKVADKHVYRYNRTKKGKFPLKNQKDSVPVKLTQKPQQQQQQMKDIQTGELRAMAVFEDSDDDDNSSTSSDAFTDMEEAYEDLLKRLK